MSLVLYPLQDSLCISALPPQRCSRFGGGLLLPELNTLSPNNRLVIYEMPTALSRAVPGSAGVGAGTFQDVRSLVDEAATGRTSATLRSQVRIRRIWSTWASKRWTFCRPPIAFSNGSGAMIPPITLHPIPTWGNRRASVGRRQTATCPISWQMGHSPDSCRKPHTHDRTNAEDVQHHQQPGEQRWRWTGTKSLVTRTATDTGVDPAQRSKQGRWQGADRLILDGCESEHALLERLRNSCYSLALTS